MKTRITTLLLLSTPFLLWACSNKTSQSTATSSSQSVQAVASSTSKQANSSETEVAAGSQTQTSSSSEAGTTSSQASGIISHEQLLALPATSLPEELIGTWVGSSQQARSVEVTISSDGTYTTTADYRTSDDEDEDFYVRTEVGQIIDLVEYKPNYYIIREGAGESSALRPGVTGLGGPITPGFILENGQYKVIFWGNAAGPEAKLTYDLETEPFVRATLEKVNQ